MLLGIFVFLRGVTFLNVFRRPGPTYSNSGKENYFTINVVLLGWLGSRVVNVLDSGAEGPGFKS